MAHVRAAAGRLSPLLNAPFQGPHCCLSVSVCVVDLA